MKEKRKNFKEKPLWRKINTTAHGHNFRAGEKYQRGKKESIKEKSKMTSSQKFHGLDFSPLFGYLRKNVGKEWDIIYSNVIKRIPKEYTFNNGRFTNPIWWGVLKHKEYLGLSDFDKKNGFFISGESSYYSLLYIDENGILQYVSPDLSVEDIKPTCTCCTHTFNGKQIPKVYK